MLLRLGGGCQFGTCIGVKFFLSKNLACGDIAKNDSELRHSYLDKFYELEFILELIY